VDFVADARDGGRLPVDFCAVDEANNEYGQFFVYDLADEPVITNAIFPELPEF